MLSRPNSCRGCDLDTKGAGFAPPEGPTDAELLFLGESLGATEAATGRPFVGDAGSMLQRIFNLLGWERGAQRIGNSIACRPPNDWLDERAPWYYNAIAHCAVHRDPLFAEPHKVTVALGGTALKVALGLVGQKKIKVQDWHGTINQAPDGRIVVPTFHPSFLQRGAHNLIGTVLWDLQQAKRAAQEGYQPDREASLVEDPPVEWFKVWVDTVLAAVKQDPTAYPVSVDVETPDKAHGKDEGEITVDDRSFTILRVNVACHPDEGITVPFVGPYVDELTRLFSGGQSLFLWNKEYDIPRLVAANVLPVTIDPYALDLMWLWHALQSDLPRGLGFVAPFYSGYGPWKHLADSRPALYGAIDGLQTHRVGFGILGDLHRLGMHTTTLRHVHQLHHQALKPAQNVGVKIDRSRLTIFSAQLATKASDRLEKLQECFPIDLRNLSPKQGLTKKPADNVLHVKASAFTRKGKKRAGKETSEIKLDLYKQSVVVEKEFTKEILCCGTCGATEIQRRHRCEDRTLTPDPTLRLGSVVRYYWSEPFNPDSWQQVLAYIKAKKHEPGRAKKTHKETTNREALERLTKSGDPFYKYLLDYRAVQKVKGTYVDGTERRLDSDDRIHPEFCVTGDHEVLTPNGWRRFDQLQDNEQVAQWSPTDERLSFVTPYSVTRAKYKGLLSCLEGPRVSLVATPTHRVLYRYYASGKRRYQRVGQAATLPRAALIPCTGTLSGPERASGWLRLAVAVQADGCIRSTTTRFTLTKRRKQERLRALLSHLGVAWSECVAAHPKERRFTLRNDQITRALIWLGTGKTFDLPRLLTLSGKAKSEFVTETTYWDGHRGKYQVYFTTNSHNADVVQTLAHLCGQAASLTCDVRGPGLRPYYTVIFSTFDLQGRAPLRAQRNFVGLVYCVTVPTEFFLIRHSGKIYVTGNTFKPSTMRLSAQNPNITNVIQDRGGVESLAAGFRSCVVADVDCWLLEVDFSGSEAVDVGWLSRDPGYIRLAKLGVHAGLASHILKRPYDPNWSDEDLGAYFKTFKEADHGSAEAVAYERSKRFVHGYSYGLTIPGMVLQFPEVFQTKKIAEQYADLFRSMAPKVPAWQRTSRELAHKQHYLGGPGAHPFGYKHWFWSVFTYKKITSGQYWALLARWKKSGKDDADAPVAVINGQYFRVQLGEDGKRCVAFMPQSITAGKLKEVMLRLFDPESPSYIGEAFYGRTPLRAPIHDSLLLEIPKKSFDMVASLVYQEMTRPIVQMPCPAAWGIGDYLVTGASAKVGADWQKMQKFVPELGVGSDTVVTAAEPEEADEVADLGRTA